MGKVEEISSCIVGMARSGGCNNNNTINIHNSIPISRLDLTPWDLQLLPMDPIQKGILFHKPPHYSPQALIPHLKTSLSQTLDFFPPLAGRLVAVTHDDGTSSFFLECNNAGVQFIHAVAAATSVSDIMQPKYIPAGIVGSFFPLNGVPNYQGVSKPLLAVKVTELLDGVFIACTANHAVIDGISFWHFFNSWSEISRGFHTISKPPIFKPWFPSNVSDDNRLLRLPPIPPQQGCVRPPLLEKVFHYSKRTLAKLKAKANSEAGTDKISSLQALSAHLWWSVFRCRSAGINGDELRGREAPFMMLVGARSRIPLAEGYFGNAVTGAKTSMSAAELVQKGLGHAAVKINEMVARQTKEATIKFVEDWVENPTYHKKGSYAFVMASSPRHNVYGNDFGWGKPIAVRSGPGQKFDGKMTLFPAAETGGIDVEVCLAPETLQAMEDDAAFMEAFA